MKINLLAGTVSKELGKVMKIKQMNRLVFVWSGVIFGCLVLVLGGLFFYFKFKLSSARSELRSVKRVYSSRAAEVISYVRSKKSIEEIKNILRQRTNYRQKLEEVYRIMPANVYLVDADFESGGVLSFSGKASGVGDYENFIGSLNKNMKRKDFSFSQVIQTELIRQRNGNYRFKLNLKIKNAE